MSARNTHQHFRTALIRLRKSLATSQRELAKLSGVNHAYLSEIESGKKLPSESTVIRLVAGLTGEGTAAEVVRKLTAELVLAMYDDRVEALRVEMARVKTLRRDWE